MNVKKTSKELLADSFSQLLQEKSFDKITVTEITEKCGIAKRTFYYNFRDKYELALWFYIHKHDRYCEENKGEVTLHNFMLYGAQVLEKDRFLIMNLLQYSGQNNFRLSVYEPLVERYLNVIEQGYGETITPEIREAVEFFVGGTITYVERIFSMSDIPSPEKAIALFEACLPNILRKYLDDPRA